MCRRATPRDAQFSIPSPPNWGHSYSLFVHNLIKHFVKGDSRRIFQVSEYLLSRSSIRHYIWTRCCYMGTEYSQLVSTVSHCSHLRWYERASIPAPSSTVISVTLVSWLIYQCMRQIPPDSLSILPCHHIFLNWQKLFSRSHSRTAVSYASHTHNIYAEIAYKYVDNILLAIYDCMYILLSWLMPRVLQSDLHPHRWLTHQGREWFRMSPSMSSVGFQAFKTDTNDRNFGDRYPTAHLLSQFARHRDSYEACTNSRRAMDYLQSLEFPSHVQELMKKHHVPGLAVAVIQGDRTFSAGYGLASLDPPKPCTADTLFDIASSSKSMTAASVGLLVRDNDRYPDVQYEATMSSLLPGDFVMPGQGYTEGVTVEDVLSHRTGMPR